MAQTMTPIEFAGLPSKDALMKEFGGKALTSLRTPAFVLDRSIFERNCSSMASKTKEWGAGFRAHLKTHKTVEGARLQLRGKTKAIVVSTIMEAWHVVNSGLVADSTVNDILYGLPIAINKIQDLSKLQEKIKQYGGSVKLLIDHPDQIAALEEQAGPREEWRVFVKIDGGQRRAGVSPNSPLFKTILSKIFESKIVVVHGFYSHAGDSYGSTSNEEASRFLTSEVEAANEAAKIALSMLKNDDLASAKYSDPFVLSVGSTPTAHVASAETRARLGKELHGKLELHAGNYPILDLQQLHTKLISPDHIAHRVLSTVISYYPGRGQDGSDEALCDAGAIAMSKDTGPSGGFGEVVGRPWRLGRISQEHGILTQRKDVAAGVGVSEPSTDASLKIGEQIKIVGQHACLIAAAHPWYYIVDSSQGKADVVVDVWVPWKGW
ncbi:hypothetical protein SCHPADRAFT_868796 [Schizopora paradoxa]|uniref:D-serine dehydratase n=1 Tax=Schizopora paradoxa TaxID=27342 RepID=A0A0H2RY76_9AGAM|nr:hypothetical protein SCHPADRAFT_868796 [Schizopora paradoxa]